MLEDLGNLGDFVGGIAVVVTLIYLAHQIRQNTATVEVATIQSASQAFAEILDSFMRDSSQLEIFLAGTQDFDALSPIERQRFASIMGSMLHRMEGLVALSDRGILPPRSWDGAVNRFRDTFARPGTLVWWERGKHVFNSRLQEWIEQEVIGHRAQAPSD